MKLLIPLKNLIKPFFTFSKKWFCFLLSLLREKSGYTQNGLAERAGVSQTHLRRVELGQADITVNHLQLICDALGITLKEFFDDGSDANDIVSAFSKLSPKQKKLLLAFVESL